MSPSETFSHRGTPVLEGLAADGHCAVAWFPESPGGPLATPSRRGRVFGQAALKP